MTLKLLATAAGLLAVVAGLVFRKRSPKRPMKVATEQVSSDWLAQARARTDDQS